LAALLVLPSRNTFDAALAAFAEVISPGDLLCVKALAAADLTDLLVEVLNAFEALFAALALVVFVIVNILIVGGAPFISNTGDDSKLDADDGQQF
jgi:hypothetical protein